MKDVQLALKAVLITPVVIAIGMLLIVMSYLIYPVIILVGIFSLLKAHEQEEEEEEDDNEDKDWSVPKRHR